MSYPINKVLLIDDNKATNFINKKFMDASNTAEVVMVYQNPLQALNYLAEAETQPELIFLDVNMPAMDAWEFLDAYREITAAKNNTTIALLTTTISPSDQLKVKEYPEVDRMLFKPLSVPIIENFVKEHFVKASA